MRFWTLIFIALCQFTAAARVSTKPIDPCQLELTQGHYFQRGHQLKPAAWTNDLEVIRANLEMQAWSSVRTFFSREWDTQVFYTATGVPKADLEIPLVDPDCKGVVFFVHGVGTVKSSGSNFIMNMSGLSNMGYCGVSIDLPFHANGSLKDKYMSGTEFIAYMKKIILEIKSYGKPVFLAGHSFGPDVIFELISRYPNLVDGALAMSPAGFTPILRKWYRQFTTRMIFGGNVLENRAGGEWSEAVSATFGWPEGKYGDPTLINPGLILRILSGDREEYSPAPTGGPNRTPIGKNTYDHGRPLQRLFRNATVTIEPGVGHSIFDFKDSNGINIVQRELTALLGIDLRNTNDLLVQTSRLREEKRTPAEKLAFLSQTDMLFRSWFLEKYNERLAQQILKNQDNTRAASILSDFNTAIKERYRSIMPTIIATETTDPEFYAANKVRIEKLKANNRPDAVDIVLMAQYYIYMNHGQSISIQ
jgi:pimeloyl-ACP methyl ester carboxylesterase